MNRQHYSARDVKKKKSTVELIPDQFNTFHCSGKHITASALMSDSMTKLNSTCVLIFFTVSNVLKHIFHKGQERTLNNTGFLLNMWQQREKQRMQKLPDFLDDV